MSDNPCCNASSYYPTQSMPRAILVFKVIILQLYLKASHDMVSGTSVSKTQSQQGVDVVFSFKPKLALEVSNMLDIMYIAFEIHLQAEKTSFSN